MASVTALSRDQVKGFWERHYVGRNALVAIVGDLDRAGAERVARALVGALPSGEPQPPLPAVEAPVSARTGLDHPSTQTHLLMGAPAITRLDPDYFPLYVGNHALGGSGLVSLLAEEVREKRGLSYSVYSALVPMRAEGPFFIGLQTRNEQAPEALEVALQTLGRFLDQGPSEEDLDAAKRNLTGGFPLRLDSNRKILGQLTAIGFYRLPLDYLETFTAKVNAVGREDVREAFRRHVTLDRLATVLVGKLTSPTAEPAGTGP
jgi:zinc protease